jgi:hypothetical protein
MKCRKVSIQIFVCVVIIYDIYLQRRYFNCYCEQSAPFQLPLLLRQSHSCSWVFQMNATETSVFMQCRIAAWDGGIGGLEIW